MADQNYTRQAETFRGWSPTSTTADVQPITRVGAHHRTYKGVQSLVLSGTASPLSVPGGATHADIYAEGDSTNAYCRYWHGATPTSTVGKKLKDHEEIATADPATFQAITSSGSITLRVEYYAYE